MPHQDFPLLAAAQVRKLRGAKALVRKYLCLVSTGPICSASFTLVVPKSQWLVGVSRPALQSLLAVTPEFKHTLTNITVFGVLGWAHYFDFVCSSVVKCYG